MSIEVEVKSQGFDVDDRLYDYVTKKASKLDRYITGLESAYVELTFAKSARQTSDRFVAQITLLGKKMMLRAEERADDVYAAYDLSLSKIQRRIERYKGKKYRGRGDGTSVSDVAMEIAEEEVAAELPPEPEPVIARRKKFTLIPMNEMEAIEQSKQLGHEDFFIFFNMETNSVNVLYLRRDGTYGLIDTEVG